MKRFCVALLVSVTVLLIGGCSAMKKLGDISVSQEWSQNYALLPGVKATDPKMVDGNLMTSGETVFRSVRSLRGSHSEAFVELPEAKMIHKVVIYSPNIQSFTLWADDGSGYDTVKEVKKVDSNPIVVRASFRAKRIMITPRIVRRVEERKTAANRRREQISGVIQEIELYGFVEQGESEMIETATDAQLETRSGLESKPVVERLEDLLEPVNEQP